MREAGNPPKTHEGIREPIMQNDNSEIPHQHKLILSDAAPEFPLTKKTSRKTSGSDATTQQQDPNQRSFVLRQKASTPVNLEFDKAASTSSANSPIFVTCTRLDKARFITLSFALNLCTQ